MAKTLLTDTPLEANTLATMVLEWEKERGKFLSDPESVIGECSDFIENLDLTPLVRTMQSRISASGSISEASVIVMYRTLDSLLEEYRMRTMSRADYAKDAIKDQEAHLARIQADSIKFTTLMKGEDITQR